MGTLEIQNYQNETVIQFLRFNDGEFWIGIPMMKYAPNDPLHLYPGIRMLERSILEYLCGIAARQDAWRFPYTARTVLNNRSEIINLNTRMNAADLAAVTGYSTDDVRHFLRNHLTFGQENEEEEQ